MKGLNKLALATAVAAAPFATQAMEPMSESEMGNTTGQAGVTIELETRVGMDQIEYNQTTEDATTGSFLVNGVNIEGQDGDALDLAVNVDLVEQDATQEGIIQQLAADDAVDSSTNRGPLNEGDALISVTNIENDPEAGAVDMNIGVDSAGIEDSDSTDGATLVSDLDMDLFLSQLDIVAQVEDINGENAADAAGSIGVDVAFAIDNMDVDFDVAAVGLEGMRMAGAGTLDALEEGTTTADYTSVDPAVVSMDIGSGGSLSDSGPEDTLRVSLANFQADMYIDSINIGGADGSNPTSDNSIGSVGISNLQVTDTEMAVYGRE